MDKNRLLQKFRLLLNRTYDQRFRDIRVWEDLARYIQPDKQGFSGQIWIGMETNRYLYDDTAIQANILHRSMLAGGLTNRATKWFDLRLPGGAHPRTYDGKQWCERTRDILLQQFDHWGFYRKIEENYLDDGCFGTSALMVEERAYGAKLWRGFRFTPIPLKQLYLLPDENGEPTIVFRKYQDTALNILANYHDDDIPESLKDAASENPGQLMDITIGMMPVYVLTDETPPEGEHQFTGIHVLEQGNHILRMEKYWEHPCPVGFYYKRTEEHYGRSPGWLALPTIRELNHLSKRFMQQADMAIFSPYLADVDVIPEQPEKILPGTFIPVLDVNRLKKWETSGDLSVAIKMYDEYKQKLERHFSVDQIRLPELDRQTATEVLARTDRARSALGPVLNQIADNKLSPVLRRSMGLLERAGMLPPEPPEIAKVKKAGYHIEASYTNPISRGQKYMETEAIQQLLGASLALTQSLPEIADKIDYDRALERLAEGFSTPPDVLRDNPIVQNMREQRMRAQEQAMKMQQAQQLSEIAGNSASASEAMQKLRGVQALQ